MKFVHPDDTNRDEKDEYIRKKAEPAIRYAEILLIYAEALNELTGSYTVASWNGETQYTIQRDINEMKKGIQLFVFVPEFPIILLRNMKIKIFP